MLFERLVVSTVEFFFAGFVVAPFIFSLTGIVFLEDPVEIRLGFR